MNILLTNDDGFGSEGIQKLAADLRSRGKHRVFIIAPDTNRSGISNALSILNGPIKITPRGEDNWICSGYPGDCVIIGMKGALPVTPDLVLSGINVGENLGNDIIYSGTAAAARQASLYGVPSIALSLVGRGNYFWDIAASWVTDHLEELISYWSGDSFVNVNIPNCSGGPQGIALTWPALKDYRDTMSIENAPDGSRLFLLKAGVEKVVEETGSDCDVVSRNYVSVSPVYNYPAVLRDICPGSPDHASVARRAKKG